jgi:hypothetical protein
LQSEAISTTPWALVRSTVNIDSINSPIGTLSADELVANVTGPNGSWTSQIVSAITGTFSISIYAKQSTSSFLQVRLDGLGAVIFDLSNATIKASSVVVGSIVDAGDGWYRCTISGTATGQTAFVFIVGNSSMTLATWFSTLGDSVYLWGAQLETGDIATDYIATTTAAVSVGPVSGTPRLDYLNGECPSLLLEPQRTNIQASSEDFNTGPYTKIELGVISNATTAPDGYNGADKIFATGGNTRHLLFGVLSVNGTYTFSVFAKAGEKNWLILRLDDDTPEVNTWFNLSTGTIGTSQGGNPTITPYGNGWYRCSVTYTTSGLQTIYNVMYVANADGVQQWTPSGTDGLYIWGAQVEAALYATSYIPTLGTSVTRVADVASKTGISSLIGQTEGTLFFEGVAEPDTEVCNLNRSTINSVFIYTRSTGGVAAFVYADSVGINLISAVPSSNRFKAALAYKSNSIAFYVNGNLIAEDTTATFTPNLTMDRFDIGLGGYVSTKRTSTTNQALIFKTRLDNATLQSLTTL